MKHRYSLFTCIFISVILLTFRLAYSDVNNYPLKVTTWDAFGYYYYLPGIFIYDDISQLEWVAGIDEEYQVTGGDFHQAELQENGNYVGKYLGGVAILQTPFFLMGHAIAKCSHYKADGFSPPYQYAIAFAGVFYGILAIFMLRFLMLKYFDDWNVAITIGLLILASNAIQYLSVDTALSHSFIIFLYPLVIYFTMKWHEHPSKRWAALTALIIGFATMCRPTEAIMILIPILWNTHSKEQNKLKWALVKQYKSHLIIAVLFGLIGVLPQLIYWKMIAGTFIHQMGSKWFFLNPFFRVLFGWVNGSFIYTPVTILFILSLFYIKKLPFKNAFIAFCVLNIWIIISWSDWRYGATYATRALVQSYPVFAFGLAALVTKITASKLKIPFYFLGVLLIATNLFQTYQYNAEIIHFRDMNRKYYASIFFNPNPTALDMSLLDTDEVLGNTDNYKKETILQLKGISINSRQDSLGMILEKEINPLDNSENNWLKIKSNITTEIGFFDSFIYCELIDNDEKKQVQFRLSHALAKPNKNSAYEFFIKIPEGYKNYTLKVYIKTGYLFKGDIVDFEVEGYFLN